MRVAARIARLRKDVCWMQTEGWFEYLRLQLCILEETKRLSDFLARKAAAEEAARVKAARERLARQKREAEAAAEAAALAALPPPPKLVEVVMDPVAVPEPEPAPPPSMDIPEQMQIRPITYRQRGPEDWAEEITKPEDEEYDPFRGYDDYDSS